MKKPHISDTKLPVPIEILNQHVAVLGKTRSGKSSVMRGLVENLLEREQPVCIVDPKGDWWGIKLAADGKRPGYPVVIFGGDHGDVPINEHAGAHVAELFATGNRPCLIDLGGWTVSARTTFWIDFASTLFKHTRGNRWLVVDEVHNFAPKGSLKGQEGRASLALHWTNRLASEGLGKGVIMLFASQRPQKVHNDTLTSAETLIAMRVLHPSDRGAVSDWIKGCGDAEGSEVLSSLAQMERGEGWVWSPEIGFGPQRVKFPMFATYDSFRPQTVDDTKRLKGWAEVDLEDVRQKMATYIEKAKADNPAELKRIIAQLQKELKAKPVATSMAVVKEAKVDPEKLKERAQKIADRAVRKTLVSFGAPFRRVAKSITDAGVFISELEKAIDALLVQVREIESAGVKIEIETPTPRQATGIARVASVGRTDRHLSNAQTSRPTSEAGHRPPASASDNGDLGKGERAILTVLAQYPHGKTRRALGTLSGYSSSGGSFGTYLSRLRGKGYIDGSDLVRITDNGTAALGEFEPLPRGEDLQRYWLSRLGKGEAAILGVLLGQYPNVLDRDELGRLAGYEASGGSFGTYLSRLRTKELIDERELRASEAFFE